MKYGLSEEQLAQIISFLAKYPEVERAILFGSRAIDTFKAASDVDIAIDGACVTHALAARIKLDFEEDTYLPYFFDIIAYPLISEPALTKHIDRKGIVLYQRQNDPKTVGAQGIAPEASPEHGQKGGVSGWRACKLGSTGRTITGKTPSKDNPEDWGSEVLFITPSDYKNYGKKAFSSIRMLSKIGVEKQKNRFLPIRSVLVTCIGSDMGKTVINALPCVTNQQINAIIPDQEKVDSDYLYYVTKDLYETLSSLGSDGTAVPILNKSDFENIDILLPPLPEQKAIAAVLSSLDDKIDLLHRQNQTLEAMAQTLFRQWFIEEAGEDWQSVLLGEYVTCFNGVSYKSSELNPSKVAMVTLKSFDRNGGFRLDGFKEFTGKFKENHIVAQGDLVVAHTDITQDAAVIGNPVLVVNDSKYEHLVISMDLVKVQSKYSWLSNEFLYHMMMTREFKEHCLGYSNGSTVLHLNKQAIPLFEFLLPPQSKVEDFSKLAKELFHKKFQNIDQIQTLTQLRDTLLPKLMSGEMRVS